MQKTLSRANVLMLSVVICVSISIGIPIVTDAAATYAQYRELRQQVIDAGRDALLFGDHTEGVWNAFSSAQQDDYMARMNALLLPTQEEVGQALGAQNQAFAERSEREAKEEGSCSIFSGDFVYCAWKWLLNLIGTLLMTLSAAILFLAGKVFDTFLDLMILKFPSTFETVIGGIQIGWELFRDLANIGIIGIFTFVAIMTILGSADYGAKKLIARVLIVAVLINFSFLFTNLAIASTNYLSAAFWKTMSAEVQTKGTAQAFLDAFGIEDYWTDSEALVKKASDGTDRSWAGLLYGIIGAVMFCTIAVVLLYGAAIITARALLLLFSLLTSSLAFASIMLPRQTANIPFIGWDAWKSNLIKAALFGPILIMFLWVVTRIIAAANPKGAGAAIAQVAVDPNKTSPDAWQQMIVLIIGTGILFVAIKAAGSFANSIAGYSSLKWGLGASLAVGAGGLGFLGRRTLGRFGTWQSRQTDNAISAARVKLAQLENDLTNKAPGVSERQVARARRSLDNLVKDSRIYDKLSKGTLDATKTGLVKQIVSGLGAGGVLGGKAESSGARAERLAKEAAKQSEKYALSDSNRDALIKEQRKALERQREDSSKQLVVAQKTLEAVRGSGEHRTQRNVQEDARKEIDRIKTVAEEQIKQMGRSGASEAEIRNRMSQRDSDLRREEEKIEKARTAIVNMEKNAINKVQEHKTKTAALSDNSIEERTKATVNKMTNAATEKAQESAARYAAGWLGSTNSTIAGMAQDELRKTLKTKKFKEQWKAFKELGDEGGDKKPEQSEKKDAA